MTEKSTPETGAPPEGSFDFGLRGYNEFWIDPGNTLAQVGGEYRSSYIVIPENGQVPRLENPNLDFEPKRFGSRYVTGIGDASGPEAIPLAERCLLGFRQYRRARHDGHSVQQHL